MVKASTLVRGAREMPTLGPESLDLIFRLGCLTTAQLRTLLPVRRSASQVQRITKALRSGGLLETVRRPYPYSRQEPPRAAPEAFQGSLQSSLQSAPQSGAGPMGAGSLGQPGGTATSGFSNSSSTRWASIHYLTENGLSLVARSRDLYPTVAKSLYDRVLDEARVYHALLRNEFYARLVEDLTEARASGASSVEIETLCAESGYTPMRLADGKNSKARYLNPDGVLEFGDAADPSFYERILVESDTGSQDMPWQIAQKAEKFAEYLLGQLEGHRQDRPFVVPKVVFVSPAVARSRWVRETFVENAKRPDGIFREARSRLRELGGHGIPAGPNGSASGELADAVLFTNFPWLAKRTTVGRAYWPLSSNELVTLTDETVDLSLQFQ